MSGGEVTLHASCVAIGGQAVLITGPSGSGKSDLALRLIDRGAHLVSDDYTRIRVEDGALIARAPEAIAGKLEVRGVGIVALEAAVEVPVRLAVALDLKPERMPGPDALAILGLKVPRIGLAPLEASAPVKLEWALRCFGHPPS